MAVLPGPESVGPAPDVIPRLGGVGHWDPRIISEATQQAGRGFDTLGRDITDAAAQQQERTNQLQAAQARGTIVAAATGAQAKMPTLTSPDMIQDAQQDFGDTANAALATVSDPRTRSMLQAELMPHMAETAARFQEHATTLDNQTQLAGLDQTTNTIIKNLATNPDETASRAGLDAIAPNIQAAQDRGILNPVQAQQYREATVEKYVNARHDFIVDNIERVHAATGVWDWSPLERFAAANALPGSPSAPGLAAPMDTPAQRVAAFAQPIQAAAQKYGVSPDFLAKTAYIESRGDPSADNGFARGLMQFSDGTAAQYGVNQKDPASSIDGAARYAVDNAKVLTAALGRAPTDAELYLAHQQDGSGAAKLLTNPDTPAGQLVAPAAIRKNGGDPNAPASQFTSMWIKKFDATPSFAAVGSASPFPGLPRAPAGAQTTAAAPTAANSYFLGDSIGEGLQGAVPGALGRTQVGASPQAVQNAIASTDPKDLQGKTIYLSSGASNAHDPAAMKAVESQIQTLIDKGVDPKSIRLLGVGDRADFVSGNVNGQLAAIAAKTGATFTGPLEASNLGPDRVHPVSYQQGLSQVAGTNAMAAGAPAAPGGSQPIDPSGYPIVPAKNEWPVGTDHVAANPDGTFSYVNDNGARTPVPGIRPTGAPAAPIPETDRSIIGALPAQKQAELHLRIGQEIQQFQRAAAAQNTQQDKSLERQITDAQARMVQGYPPSPDEWSAIRASVATSTDPTMGQRFALADAAKNTIADLRGLTPAQVNDYVDNARGIYSAAQERDPSNPHTAMLGAALKAAEDYEKIYSTDVAKDSLGRALKEGMLPQGVPPITPGTPNLTANIQQRVVAAHIAAEKFGLTTPQFLFPQDRVALKNLAAAGGEPMVDFAKAVVSGAGNDAGAIFKEMHSDAGFLKTIGGLALIDAPAETLDDYAKYTSAMHDKDARKELMQVKESDRIARGADDPIEGAGSGLGFDAVGRLRDMANVLVGADAMRKGITDKKDLTQAMFDDAYNKALGATIQGDGTRYGGVTDIGSGWSGSRSSQKVFVPPNIRADKFEDVINSLNDQDIKAMPEKPYLGGKALNAQDIKSAHLVAVPDASDGLFHGLYRPVMGDPTDPNSRPVGTEDGKPWYIDMRQLEGPFKQRFPGAYLAAPVGRADQRARSAAQPYARVSGVQPASAEAEGEGPTIPQEQ